MKNKEKYAEEITQAFVSSNNCSIRKKIVLKKDSCDDDFSCGECREKTAQWLEEEYIEPLIDWNNIPIDTKILVKNHIKADWRKRHFAKYEDGEVYTFNNGATSWSTETNVTSWINTTSWEYAKLAKDGEEYENNQ